MMYAEQPDCTYDPWQPKKLLDAPVPPRIFRQKSDPPWAFNPWTGNPRAAGDIETDVFGRAIWLSAWGPLRAAPTKPQALLVSVRLPIGVVRSGEVEDWLKAVEARFNREAFDELAHLVIFGSAK